MDAGPRLRQLFTSGDSDSHIAADQCQIETSWQHEGFSKQVSGVPLKRVHGTGVSPMAEYADIVQGWCSGVGSPQLHFAPRVHHVCTTSADISKPQLPLIPAILI